VCRDCWRHVSHKKFTSVPLCSWANGCWLGDVPDVLSCLTYLEELVIARAHATKCWGKFNEFKRDSSGAKTTSKNEKPRGPPQRGTGSNVCFHPHEIRNVTSRLPRPFDSLYDEIAVVIVSNDNSVTAETFEGTPFLVRRQKILDALIWLKANNRFYHDIEIDLDALSTYPDTGDVGGLPPVPVHVQK
ncbi:hypothetical protein K435DRAFT_612718, partial [Dendrothele bispora CBS 962.96]